MPTNVLRNSCFCFVILHLAFSLSLHAVYIILTVSCHKSVSYSSNNVVRCIAKLFSVSDEFRLFCTKVGITPHWIDVTPVDALRCSVHKNFAMIWLLWLHDVCIWLLFTLFISLSVTLTLWWINVFNLKLVCHTMSVLFSVFASFLALLFRLALYSFSMHASSLCVFSIKSTTMYMHALSLFRCSDIATLIAVGLPLSNSHLLE